jgi:DNA polymerase-3 subunit alpha
MGKKIREEMDRQKNVFIEGCKKHSDIDQKLSNEIFDLLAKFAEYGFNKSHAAAYAMIGYQTAYLKVHYPVEFMTATLNMEIMDFV